MKNILARSFEILSPLAKPVGSALATGALMEIGSSLVKENSETRERAGNLLGFAKTVGLELLGQAPLPGQIPVGGEEPTVEAALLGEAAPAEKPQPSPQPRRVPLVQRRPARQEPPAVVAGAGAAPPIQEIGGAPDHARIPTQPAASTPQTQPAPAPATPQAVAAPAASAPVAAPAPASPPAAKVETPAMGATPASSVRTMCTCAVSGGALVLAGPGERIELKQCDACHEKALARAKYNLGMVLGWADAWKGSTGIDPTTLGEVCDARPSPNSPVYQNAFGFDDQAFNTDLLNWQRCASAAAQTQAKMKVSGAPVGDAAPKGQPAQAVAPAASAPVTAPQPAAAAPASVAPASPHPESAQLATPPPASTSAPTPTEHAALVVSQAARRAEKHIEALKDRAGKAVSDVERSLIQREVDRASETKHHADAVKDHLQKESGSDQDKAVQAKLVADIHDHVSKGPDFVASMLPSLFAMLPEVPAEIDAMNVLPNAPPWGMRTPPPAAVQRVATTFFLDDDGPVDFPARDDGNSDLNSLPVLAVQGAPEPAKTATPPEGQPQPAAVAGGLQAPPVEGAMVQAPEIGSAVDVPRLSMDLSEFAFGAVDDESLEGLSAEDRSMVLGYAQAGYSEEDIREYAAMFRAAAGNQHENPGSCDSGCPIRR